MQIGTAHQRSSGCRLRRAATAALPALLATPATALLPAIHAVLATAVVAQPTPGDCRGTGGIEYEVRVHTPVELFAAMARLAGFREYQGAGIAVHDVAADAWLEPHRDHPAIAVVRRLRDEVRLSYNMPVELGLLIDEETWQPRVPLDPLPPSLDGRWTPVAAAEFLRAARDFARDANADEFFAASAPLYGEIERHLREALQSVVDLCWFERQFGALDGSFTIVPALLTGPHSYGPHNVLPDGRTEVFAVLGTPRIPAHEPVRYPIPVLTGLLVHELAHSWINPWVDRHATRLDAAGRALFEATADRMKASAYGEPRILLYESLVRATTIRYFLDRGDSVGAAREVRDDRSGGFLWTDELAEVLGPQVAVQDPALGRRQDSALGGRQDRALPRHEAARDAVFAFFDAWGAAPDSLLAARRQAIDEEDARRQAVGPQIVRSTPAFDDGAVSPAVDTLVLEFDRPMAGGMAIMGSIELTGRATWDEERRTLRLPVRLVPGTMYELQLNTEEQIGFRSADGEPLVPRRWTFTVGQPISGARDPGAPAAAARVPRSPSGSARQ
jgi:hypothetical protein